MKQSTWLRTVHSGDWCLHLALCTPSGAWQKRRRRRSQQQQSRGETMNWLSVVCESDGPLDSGVLLRELCEYLSIIDRRSRSSSNSCRTFRTCQSTTVHHTSYSLSHWATKYVIAVHHARIKVARKQTSFSTAFFSSDNFWIRSSVHRTQQTFIWFIPHTSNAQ